MDLPLVKSHSSQRTSSLGLFSYQYQEPSASIALYLAHVGFMTTPDNVQVSGSSSVDTHDPFLQSQGEVESREL